MADKKISALTGANTPLVGTEVLPIVQSGATVKVSVSDLTSGRNIAALGATVGKSFETATKSWVNSDLAGVAFYEGTNYPAAFNYGRVLDINAGSANSSGGSTIRLLTADGNNAGSESVVIDKNGKVTISRDNLVVGTAGKGIDFSANTHAPGMTSELLNDYEEGTWTPSVGGDATYFSQNGTYTKIGRLVFIQGLLYINVQGTGSATTISGLPFTPGADSTATLTYFSGLATNVVFINGRIASGASDIVLYGLTAAGAAAQTPITTFQNQTYIQFSAVYSV